MNTNLNEIISESNRILNNDNGRLIIAEISSRFGNKHDSSQFENFLKKCGFKLENKKNLTDHFVLFEFVKEVNLNSKVDEKFSLNPCLYKKR